jgi:hypothetical protein
MSAASASLKTGRPRSCSIVTSWAARGPRVLGLSLSPTRTLRAEIMAMAVAAERESGGVHVLCLESPRMTDGRIETEWKLAGRVLRPEVLKRLAVHVSRAGGGTRSFGEMPEPVVRELCRDAGRRERGTGNVRLPPPNFRFVVLKLFVYAWLTKRGPVTARWLAETAGCSYPTVASATRRLGRVVLRRKDRRLQLGEFPRQEWARLLLVAEEARSTVRFADRSGQPRSASSLVERLVDLRPQGAALGGVLGAAHHHPELDVAGLPRLDVSVHCRGRSADLSFVRRLDPALEATSDPTEPARVVVHFVRHAESLFEVPAHGLPWADPVECLMDLHEARLESQAAELVRALGGRGREGDTSSPWLAGPPRASG